MDFSQKVSVASRILGAHFFGMRFPLACHYSVTNRCPWACEYCGFRYKDKSECTTEEAKNIIAELARAGNVRLHLVGGEPTLRNDLGELVEQAKKHNLFVTIATTGFRFPEIWEKLKDIDIFFLSFDGPQDIHDAQRGKGAFRTLFRAVDLLRTKGKKFWTTTVITRKNACHIDYILDVAKRMKFKVNFHLLYYTDTHEYLDKSFHLPSVKEDLKVEEEYRAVLERLLKDKMGAMKDVIANSEPYFRTLIEWKDYRKVYLKEPSPHYKCWAGKLHCFIDANGDLYPCGDIMGRVEPRNILKLGFTEAFRTLPPIPCYSCLVACYNELNLLFSLNLKAILNWTRQI